MSRSSLKDEVALQVVASSARDAADSPCQVLLFVSFERPFVNRIAIFYNVTAAAGVRVLSNVCDQFKTSEALVRLQRSTTGLGAIARRAPVQANGSRK